MGTGRLGGRIVTHNEEVCRAANGLRALGLGKGDGIGLYMPMCPELVIALLAVAKIGGIILPLFSGFGHSAIVSRLTDAGAKALIAADGMWRRGQRVAGSSPSGRPRFGSWKAPPARMERSGLSRATRRSSSPQGIAFGRSMG